MTLFESWASSVSRAKVIPVLLGLKFGIGNSRLQGAARDSQCVYLALAGFQVLVNLHNYLGHSLCCFSCVGYFGVDFGH